MSIGSVVVKEDAKKIEEVKKRGIALFCGGNNSITSFSKPKLKMDF
jgi:hypothetical protein